MLPETLQKNGQQRVRERFSVQRSAEDLETFSDSTQAPITCVKAFKREALVVHQ